MARLRRSMDFASKSPSRLKPSVGKLCAPLANIYQQLCLAWEFLGLQCRHWDGFEKAMNGNLICKICGKVKNRNESWLLLPNNGRKFVGHRLLPTSKKTFSSQKKARLLFDSIYFHGAKLKVEVQNAFYSSLFGKKRDITIAADRLVKLSEGEIECDFSTHTIHIGLSEKPPKMPLPYGAFPWELSRKQLKKFPIVLEHDRQGRFVGLTLFRQSCFRSNRVSRAKVNSASRHTDAIVVSPKLST